MISYIFIFFTSILITIILVPIVKNTAEKFKIFDKPEVRKQHKLAMVRLGGIALFISFLITLFLYDIFFSTGFIKNNYGILFLIVGFFLTGVIDDIFRTPPWPRLMVEVVLASLAWINNFGIYVVDFSFLNSSQFIILPKILSYLISVFWIVGVTNAINWMDGLDGLAAGLVFIYAIAIGLVSYIFGNINEVIFLSAISGICIGFLKSNFFPSKILMGDGGSYLLGFSISIFSITSSTTLLDNNSSIISTAFLIPFLLLLIPLMDMIYVVFKRLLTKNSPFYPDRNHLHHRLIDNGFSHKNSVFLIYLFSLMNVLIVILFKLFFI